VSLIDLSKGKGEVVAEIAVGKRPVSVRLSRNGRQAIVSNWLSDTITALEVADGKLRLLFTMPVGDEPRGVALAANGTRAYVAVSLEDAVAVVDLKKGQVVGNIAVGDEPWHLALSPDDRWLVVGNSRSQDISLIDLPQQKVARTVRLAGDNLRHVAISSDGQWAYLTHIIERGFPTTRADIERGWVLASRISRVPLVEDGPREAIALDTRGKAVGDPHGIAVSPDLQWLAVSASGTHELLLFKLPLPFVAYGGPGDFIEPDLLGDPNRFQRIPLGGRPMSLTFSPDSKRIFIANYLTDSLQIVEVAAGRMIQSIHLGGPAEPSLVRKGETIFYDATRSFNHWFSCNTCHVDGHTNGLMVDTLLDGKYGNPKKTVSLRGVVHTSPWTWHGYQNSLEDSIIKSLTTTMQGLAPSEEDVKALMAFLASLDYSPNPNRLPNGSLSEAAKRGEKVFDKSGCPKCHLDPYFTSKGAFDVGLGSADDVYRGFNPPSLLGVYDKAPYLHDGRAKTLEEVLTRHHRPEQSAGTESLTPQEISDLISYLRSL
jgi:DNA-binding beta-propeller fold protein YncE